MTLHFLKSRILEIDPPPEMRLWPHWAPATRRTAKKMRRHQINIVQFNCKHAPANKANVFMVQAYLKYVFLNNVYSPTDKKKFLSLLRNKV